MGYMGPYQAPLYEQCEVREMKLYYSIEQSNGGISRSGPKCEIPLDPEYPYLRAIRIWAELDGGRVIDIAEARLYHSPQSSEDVYLRDKAIPE